MSQCTSRTSDWTFRSSEARQVCEFRSIAFDPPSSMSSTRFEPFPTKNRLERHEVTETIKRKIGQRKPESGPDMGSLGGNRERGSGTAFPHSLMLRLQTACRGQIALANRGVAVFVASGQPDRVPPLWVDIFVALGESVANVQAYRAPDYSRCSCLGYFGYHRYSFSSMVN